MPVQNHEIAELFRQVASLLEIEDANTFRVRAYQNAALQVDALSHSLADMVSREEDLTALPGIGKDLAEKIKEAAGTGSLALLEEIERRLPAGLLDLLKLSGLGPKRVRALYTQLQISNLEQLQKAAAAGQIRELPGFGAKLEQQILKDLEQQQHTQKRFLISVAEPVVNSLIKYLQQVPGVKQVTAAGSFRRRVETVGDLDILATGKSDSAVMDRFVHFEDVREILSQGDTRSIVVLRTGLQVDLRLVPEESYGAALHYFTGSKAHNIAMRRLGQKRNLKINEYGVFRGNKRIAGKTEEEIYALFGMPWIAPELREMRGELEAAMSGTLPTLLLPGDIRGDLHAHTTESDGRFSLEEMVRAAQQHGYAYLAITDHSQRVTVAHGLDPKRVRAQFEAIDRLQATLKNFTILKSMEVDILEDGSLDMPDDLLAELDMTVCSVHSKFNLPRDRQTERMIRAMDNPYFSILGHPTGRLLNERPAYAVDMEKVITAAQARGCYLEINSHPQRLDLTDVYCKLCRDLGVKIAISTDAHRLADMDYMYLGVGQARRGWLEAKDVLNTRTVGELKKLLKRK